MKLSVAADPRRHQLKSKITRILGVAHRGEGDAQGMTASWKPHEKHGQLDTADRDELPDSVYAFPDKRKEPMTDASHVRNAIARFDQVKDVSDNEREQAFANIKKAADHYGVEMTANNWRELGKP
jgi:hypothetical protein